MKYFDLHCDTITELEENGQLLFENELQVDLKRAEVFDEYIQVFAIFIPDELRGQAAVEYFNRVHAYYIEQSSFNKHLISDFHSPLKTKIKSILSVEGGAAANGSIEGLKHLYDCGVRLMTLTWNGQNELGCGCFVEEDCGLTPFGIEAVKVMEKLGMIVDVSHLSKKGFWEVAKHTAKPFVASHSNCDIVDNIFAKKRNLTDDQIKCIISRKGLMGINFCSDFIEHYKPRSPIINKNLGCGHGKAKPTLGNDDNISFNAIYEHIKHVLDLGGEDILAFGCDFDGCIPHLDVRGIEKIPAVYNFLINKGLPSGITHKIFFENAHKFFISQAI